MASSHLRDISIIIGDFGMHADTSLIRSRQLGNQRVPSRDRELSMGGLRGSPVYQTTVTGEGEPTDIRFISLSTQSAIDGISGS